MRHLPLSLACVLPLLVLSVAAGQQLRWLGRLPGGSSSEATAVSDSGTLVVGRAEDLNYNWRAFRWSAEEQMVELGTLGGSASEATALSPDGSFIVGRAQDSLGRWRAFRWSASDGMQELGTLGGRESEATGVAPSGHIVGRAMNSSLQFRAFLWHPSSGMQELGTLGGAESAALALARDSLVIVGWAQNVDQQPRAFRWTSTTGMQDLGTLGGARSEASAVSADGSVVVGRAENASRLWRAFRWTASTGMLELGTLGGRESAALAVSADGTTVVGWAATPTGDWHAFRWTPEKGMEDLNTAYASAVGRSLLYVARGISADGRYIVGYGINAATGRREAYLLDTRGSSTDIRTEIAQLSLRILPHPVTAGGQLLYQVPEPMELEVHLLDLLGRELALLASGWHTAGEHLLPLPSLPAGAYTVVLRSKATVVRVPLLYLR